MSDIIDNPAEHRFELHAEDHVATERYRRDGKVITLGQVLRQNLAVPNTELSAHML